MDANAHVIAMHRHMKDVTLSQDAEDLASAIAKIDACEVEVYRLLGLVRERFLGDKERIEIVLQTFTDWRAIRNEVIDLVRVGKIQEAAQITSGKGALQVDLLNREMNELVAFARNKAMEFFSNSKSVQTEGIMQLRLLMVVILLTSGTVTYFVIHKVKEGERNLRESEERFRSFMESATDACSFFDSKLNDRSRLQGWRWHHLYDSIPVHLAQPGNERG